METTIVKESLTLNNTCRLCLSTNGVAELLEYDQSDKILLQKIYECTSLQITPMDGVPLAICAVCKERLEEFYQFRWQCIRNNEVIQRIAAESTKSLSTADVQHLGGNDSIAVNPNDTVVQVSASMAPHYSAYAVHMCGSPSSIDHRPSMIQSSAHFVPNTNEVEMSQHPPGDVKYSRPTCANFVTSEITTFRRKRGRPPKQQYEVPMHAAPTDIQPPPMNGWTGEQSAPGREFSRLAHEPPNGTSDNQGDHDWFKIKLEHIDPQMQHPTQQPVRNDLSSSASNAPFVNAEHVLPTSGTLTTTSTLTVGQPAQLKRGRGRPPREGQCPNEDREEYRFRCQFCSARFKAAINLKLHTNTHTGEKPYLCTVCSKSFAHPSNLSVHMKLHSNQIGAASDGGPVERRKQNASSSHALEKKYQCPYCRSLFALAFQLKIHINTHTGQKPYVCKNCGKGFAQPSNLQVHSKKHCRRKQSLLTPEMEVRNVTASTTKIEQESFSYGKPNSIKDEYALTSPIPPHVDVQEGQSQSHPAISVSHAMLV
ncbi:myoneurin-like [Anopheles nili]|uniref:myoneurin-like n=1 Tax=Anopheles nili TaxID=185578 RepID=UPI00237B90B9|nr:myoneurin-like [Anopheles nili]